MALIYVSILAIVAAMQMTVKAGDLEEIDDLLKNITVQNEVVIQLGESFLKSQAPRAMDCQDIQAQGYTVSGIYEIFPGGKEGVSVSCEMDDTSGRAWTVIQRRVSDSDFRKTWDEYHSGFGNKSSNYWLGNKYIARLTSQDSYELRFDLVDDSGNSHYAFYQMFSIGGPETKYKLTVDGYSGTAGNSFGRQSGYKFSTKDYDNDVWSSSCAQAFLGGWWYSNCHWTNLNGQYGSKEYGKGLSWRTVTGFYSSLKSTEMKIRRWG